MNRKSPNPDGNSQGTSVIGFSYWWNVGLNLIIITKVSITNIVLQFLILTFKRLWKDRWDWLSANIDAHTCHRCWLTAVFEFLIIQYKYPDFCSLWGLWPTPHHFPPESGRTRQEELKLFSSLKIRISAHVLFAYHSFLLHENDWNYLQQQHDWLVSYIKCIIYTQSSYSQHPRP